MATQPDGKGGLIGGKNEQFYDVAEIDRNGIYVEGSGRQLKFVGGSAEGCYKKLLTKKFDKYRKADIPIEVPADYYDGVMEKLDIRSHNLKNQIRHAKDCGKTELAEKCLDQLKQTEITKKNLRKGKLTSEEAIFARMHPKLSTAADMVKISHDAGVESAKSGVMLGGGVSLIRNSVAVIKGDKDPAEAALAVTGETVETAGENYAVSFIGSILKGAMQNAPSKYLQTLSKTNVPATAVTLAIESAKTLKRYGDGDINGTQCLTELGEQGTGMLAAGVGASVGQAIIPIPVLGGLVGGMMGYAMSSAYYNGLVTALNEAQLAHEERLRIEAECKECIAALREYRLDIELATRNYLQDNIEVFNNAFLAMGEAYHTGDVDLYIAGANSITRQLGGRSLFESKQEFDKLMADPKPIRL